MCLRVHECPLRAHARLAVWHVSGGVNIPLCACARLAGATCGMCLRMYMSPNVTAHYNCTAHGVPPAFCSSALAGQGSLPYFPNVEAPWAYSARVQ